MAAYTWYLINAKAGTSEHMRLNTAAPSAATTGTGWTVGTKAAGNYSPLDFLVTQLESTFASTALPDGTPNSSTGDCLRTKVSYNGTFAAGNWSISIPVIASVDTRQEGNFRIRVFRDDGEFGTSGTELTSSTIESTIIDSSTIDLSVTPVILTATWAASEFDVTNEYLFFQIAWEITSDATSSSADILIRVGSDSYITSTDFTEYSAPPSGSAVNGLFFGSNF